MKPAAFISASTASGGGAAAVANSTDVAGFFLGRRGVQQRRHHDRRAAKVRHFVIGDGVEDRRGTHRAEADMRAGNDRQGPGEAPAVAVKHRQRPQIDRMLAHAAGDDVAEREQISAAVMIHHAFRIAGGARGVVERDRVPLVAGHLPGEIRIAFALGAPRIRGRPTAHRRR